MSLRHAILGLLSIKPMSGYELKKVIDASVGHFWTADQSQIYRTLTGLVAEGLASRHTVVQTERPNLYLHRPTERGRSELDRWLASPLPAQPTREPFLARLFFADRLSVDDIKDLLDSRRRDVSEQLLALQAVEEPSGVADPARLLRAATLANGIAHCQAELDWLGATERQLDAAERQEPTP